MGDEGNGGPHERRVSPSGLLLALCVVVCSLPALSVAAQPDAYAVKGAGVASCSQYAQVFQDRAPELGSFGGWVEGYLTARNETDPNVFDFSPWQSIDYLAEAIADYCKENPKLKFHQAVRVMVVALGKTGLANQSEIVVAKHNGQAVLVYREILLRVQNALKQQGIEVSDAEGKFGPSTSAALQRYQRSQGIEESGLPDQSTLLRLIEGGEK